jgi:hypothetical protein
MMVSSSSVNERDSMPIANSRPSLLRHLLTMAGHFLGHVTAVVLGCVLIVVGLAMGVTMVLLPAGVIIGLVGVALVVGGMFARITPSA